MLRLVSTTKYTVMVVVVWVIWERCHASFNCKVKFHMCPCTYTLRCLINVEALLNGQGGYSFSFITASEISCENARATCFFKLKEGYAENMNTYVKKGEKCVISSIFTRITVLTMQQTILSSQDENIFRNK